MSDPVREAMEELEWLFKSSNLPDRAAKYNTVKAALSANGGEAVAWSRPSNPSNGGAVFTADPVVAECWKREGKTVTPLYPAPPSVAVPEGWKLVPVEPTPEMREAFHDANEEWEDGGLNSPDHQYQAMLAAAPSPDHSGDANKMVTPSVPENEIKAQALEWFARECGLFDSAYDDQEYLEIPRWCFQEYIVRLRTAGDEGEGV